MADHRIEIRDFFEELVYTGFSPRGLEPGGLEGNNRRYTQDSPVMPDVWVRFGVKPFEQQDLLLTPWLDRSPGKLAHALKERLREQQETDYHKKFLSELGAYAEKSRPAAVAYNQTTVVARLWFHELVRVALPLTPWWRDQLAREERLENHPVRLLTTQSGRNRLAADLTAALVEPAYDAQRRSATINLAWMAHIVGTISHASKLAFQDQEVTVETLDVVSRTPEILVQELFDLLSGLPDENEDDMKPLFNINRNRPAESSIYNSVPTVKADAVQQLFDVRGFGVTWAILDSGIDATHWAFRKRKGFAVKPVADKIEGAQSTFREYGAPFDVPFEAQKSKKHPWLNNTRVKKTYDFTRIRDLLSEDPPAELRDKLDEDVREELQRSLQTGRLIDWDLLEPALRIPHDGDYAKKHIPKSNHGTHVAGILAADWRPNDDPNDALPFRGVRDSRPDYRTGVCPEIELYDLRVMGPDGLGDEFSIMAALQFVRSLNARRDYVEVHGVNLSLSIRHEVSNYACGRTPVCNECARLVGGGVVVVASAGNLGRSRFLTRKGDAETYSSISITDPGNSDAVITVGATHSREPHNYGVSYFSSRGPTGDGRIKPDLVAPGEKVCSTIPGNREEFLDGTSMAAPHVSGAAALLMCRYPELIGNPSRIKNILCDTATDLGRERYFQGAGLLDILRAMQSV